MPAYHLGKEIMQSAISNRTGVFILALPPWVIAIASAGAVASDGSRPGGDLENDPGWRIPESAKTRLLKIF
jgi:hypothetical protein